MKYDDATWHEREDTPYELPEFAGATHAGMFLAWALLSGLGGELHTEEDPEALTVLRARQLTPGRFLLRFCDGKLTDEDFDDVGNAFTGDYFDLDTGHYIRDYEATLLFDRPSLYHVPDTWESYDLLAPVLDRRLAEWRASRG